MRVAGVLVVALATVIAVTPLAAAQQQDAFTWMDKNAKAFKTMINSLNITRKTFPASTTGTLLVPSDKAINTFVKQMQLTGPEFLSRKQLVDLVVSYHFIPGYQAKSVTDVPGNPTMAVTADVNYILRFYKNQSKVWVKDVQGNDVTLTKQPVIVGKISVIPVDQVLMSGGYFLNGLDALKQYPQWSEAYSLTQAAGWPVGNASADVTMFVPDNAALTARKMEWATLSLQAQKDQLLYHFVQPAMSIPHQLKSGKRPTLLAGHDLTIDVTGQKDKNGVPIVLVKPEFGPAAKVVIFNIYAGRSILQGINGSIQADAHGAATTAAAVKPASVNGRRHLLSASSAFTSTRASSSNGEHRALLGLYKRGNDMWGYNQATANSIAATNTQYAIEAAANGDIPVGAATYYGAYQAQAAADYGNHCYNCNYNRNWVG